MHSLIPHSRLVTRLVELPQPSDDVFVELSFPCGFLYAEPGRTEVPHLLEHCIGARLQAVGLDCEAATAAARVSFTGTFTQAKLGTQLKDFLGAVFTGPSFDSVTFAKELHIFSNEMAGVIHEPIERSQRHVLNALRACPPPQATGMAEYAGLTIKDMEAFYSRHIAPERAGLFIGAYQPERLRQAVLGAVQALERVPASQPDMPALETQLAPASESFAPLQLGRTYLTTAWGFSTDAIGPDERVNLLVALDLLSHMDGGLLWDSLQEEAGLVYDIEGNLDYYDGFGYLSVTTAFLPEDVSAGTQLIARQVERLRDAEYSKELLRDMVAGLVEADTSQWESNDGRFAWIVSDLLEKGQTYSLEQWKERYAAVTQASVAATVSRFLLPEHRHMIMLGESPITS